MFTQLKHARKWIDKENKIVQVTITLVGNEDFLMVANVDLTNKSVDIVQGDYDSLPRHDLMDRFIPHEQRHEQNILELTQLWANKGDES
ncbi:hypothetical protein [Alicyclobacillus suci]|uniref:hypothetical protein n=1 Tax=Alicyclobacillus suci TaxID=2816080 RepID=UPI001A8C7C33|nr:hypothetical protein [Alicyclobacillus suci]